ncbi:MAG: hypothetical protein SGJ23_08285 [Alphaproteobacteria bacterium]|nr:hypothetical protein [Alphaproteobacteria bacterium]
MIKSITAIVTIVPSTIVVERSCDAAAIIAKPTQMNARTALLGASARKAAAAEAPRNPIESPIASKMTSTGPI